MSKYADYVDEKLLILIKNQADSIAYSTIFERYSSILYSHVYNKLRNQQEAEDIVQEIFSQFWLKRTELDLSYKFPGYLFLLARNKVIDLIRRKRNSAISEEFFVNSVSFSQESTDFLLRESQFSAMIEREIALLPPRMREVFELRRKKYLTVKEISSEMGISEATVATQIKKALRILRLKLKIAVFFMLLLLFFLKGI